MSNWGTVTLHVVDPDPNDPPTSPDLNYQLDEDPQIPEPK